MTAFKGEAEARQRALESLGQGFATLPEYAAPALDAEDLAVLETVAERLADNYPYHHPLYAGQMLKPPHPLAREAYQLAQRLNPNNHALDGGRASSVMEKEAVLELAGMIGWQGALGHLTSSGTIANLEALWVAGRERPGERIVASSHAHYTHSRISAVLGLEFEAVAVDQSGRMDLEALAGLLTKGQIGTVVATLGTTGIGAVDPLPELLELAAKHGVRVHVDAAYGGYFRLADNLAPDASAAFAALEGADSFVVDPHKHGLQPYGCGCVLFRDPAIGHHYQHDSPYTYFTSDELHLGEISLECSRAGAAAVGLWAMQQRLPLIPGGEFARGLEASRQAAVEFSARLAAHEDFLVLPDPDLDIVIFAPRADGTAAGISRAASQLFDAAAERDLHLALIGLERSLLDAHWAVKGSEASVTCLRSCLMKPEHLDWLDEIWTRLTA
ncbi:MAG: aminotransferase class I/II-fold pyridoxal phosphate-dependent enzyme [Pseudomonadota bacterium]